MTSTTETPAERGITIPAHHLVGMDLGFTCTNCGGHTSTTAPCIPERTYPGFAEMEPVAEAQPEGRRSLHEAVQAAANALCACGQAGCDDSKTRNLLVALLDEQKENSR